MTVREKDNMLLLLDKRERTVTQPETWIIHMKTQIDIRRPDPSLWTRQAKKSNQEQKQSDSSKKQLRHRERDIPSETHKATEHRLEITFSSLSAAPSAFFFLTMRPERKPCRIVCMYSATSHPRRGWAGTTGLGWPSWPAWPPPARAPLAPAAPRRPRRTGQTPSAGTTGRQPSSSASLSSVSVPTVAVSVWQQRPEF